MVPRNLRRLALLAGIGLASGAVSAFATPGWTVKDIRNTATAPTNGNFITLSRAPDGAPTINTTTHNVLNFESSGGFSAFGSNSAFPQGAGNNFLLNATGFISVPATGAYTFAIGQDDPGFLQIGGLAGPSFTDTGCCATSTYTLNLTAGVHPIEVAFAEFGGGESLEISVAPGANIPFNTTNFQLLGGTSTVTGMKVATTAAELQPFVSSGPGYGFNVKIQNEGAAPGGNIVGGGIDNMNEAQTLLAGGGAPEAVDNPGVINYSTFPAGTNADQFAMEATGFVEIVGANAVNLAFYVNSDDGFRLEKNGVNVLEFFGPTGASNTLSPFLVNVANGDFLRLTYFEAGGGQFINFSRDMDGLASTTGDRFLIGTVQSGVLIRTGQWVPEPATLCLLVMAGLPMLRRRRRMA